MRFKTIQYSKLLPTSSYLNERIGVEIELESGESADEAISMAREFVKESHKKEYPELYKFNNDTPTVDDVSIIKEISTCESLQKLATYKGLLNEITKPYYTDRLKTLTDNFTKQPAKKISMP